MQELQAALKKTEEARDKNMASLATVQELTLAAAQRAQVAEHFVHAVADALADVGFDIDNLMDAATQASAGPAPAATPRRTSARAAEHTTRAFRPLGRKSSVNPAWPRRTVAQGPTANPPPWSSSPSHCAAETAPGANCQV